MEFDAVKDRELRDWLTKRKQQRDRERAQLEWYKKIFEETFMNTLKNEIEELEGELSVWYAIDIHTKVRYEDDGTEYYTLRVRYVPKGKNELNLTRTTLQGEINHDSLDEVQETIRDCHKEMKAYVDDVIGTLAAKLYLEEFSDEGSKE